MSFPNPIFCFVPEPPVAFQEVQAESPSSQGPVLNTLSSPPSSPPSTSTPSVGGGGNQKRKEQEVGLGQQEFKTNNKKQDQERRKKEKNNNQKARSSRGRFNKKRKKKKIHFLEKKKKRKNSLYFFIQNFVVKLQEIGPCFQKFPNSLICFKCSHFLHLTGLWKLQRASGGSMCHQFANLIFFSNVLLQIKVVFSNATFHKLQNSPNFWQTLNILSNFLVSYFFSDIPIFSTIFSPCLAFLEGFSSGSNFVQISFEVFIILFSNITNFSFLFFFIFSGESDCGPPGLWGYLVRGRAVNVKVLL